MYHIKCLRLLCALALAGLWQATCPPIARAAALSLPPGNLGAMRSGNDLVLSFPTTSPEFYTVQTAPDLSQPWTSLPFGVPGDGTLKQVTVSNALPAGQAFYRLMIQQPARLQLPQSTAFALLGYSCGGIQEKAYVTGFDPATGGPIGNVYLSTTCNGSGRGSRPTTHTAWAAVTWDLAGNVISATTLSNTATIDPTFAASDGHGDMIYNVVGAAYLAVPPPAAPTAVTAVQSGDLFQVAWTPNGVNPAAVTASTLTATPLNSTAPVLTTTVAGPATSGLIPSLQPQTTYQIVVVTTTLGGSSPPSIPITVTTVPASVPPSAPTGVTASWANLNPTSATDTLIAAWQPAVPGDSPIDQYRVTIVGSDGAGSFSQTVPAATFTADFNVDHIPNWSVTVQAHNAVGWGPPSAAFTLGGL